MKFLEGFMLEWMIGRTNEGILVCGCDDFQLGGFRVVT